MVDPFIIYCTIRRLEPSVILYWWMSPQTLRYLCTFFYLHFFHKLIYLIVFPIYFYQVLKTWFELIAQITLSLKLYSFSISLDFSTFFRILYHPESCRIELMEISSFSSYHRFTEMESNSCLHSMQWDNNVLILSKFCHSLPAI